MELKEDYLLSDLKELSDGLSKEDIKTLHNSLSVPDGLCSPDCGASQFLFALKRWSEFYPFNFYMSLNSVRPDLVPLALRISWVCVDTPETRSIQPLTIKSLIEILRNAISLDNLIIIQMFYTSEISGDEVRFENIMKLLLQKNLIQKNLKTLSEILKSVKLNDIASKLDAYKKEFQHFYNQEFIHKFKKELKSSAKQMAQWETSVKLFLQTQYKNVKQMLGKDQAVSLEKVYVDLTIVKEEPRSVNLEDETTYNEIAYLRKIANKEVTIEPVDFTKELESCDPSEPQTMCIIGNPGSGKTFLCNRTALRFGNDELSAFSYSLCIPCRNPNWHEMESSRHDAGHPINAEFICDWIQLGLPVGASWTAELAKHITESDGEGLLLIIDSLDEFTKQVPFNKSLLFLLLTRQALYRSYIILTSRPGAWTDMSTSHQLNIDVYYQVLGFSPEQRDLYFLKQFDDESKLERCTDLLYQHDEMQQLSLIPVNASLFAALLKGDDSKRIHTLTQLYYELILYLIRRQLCRMGLEELSKVILISDFDSGVLDCLHQIGYIAYQGVAHREMVSEEKVPLRIGKVQKYSHCLGLVQEHLKKEKMGVSTKVWSFAHLTIQEFIGAIWLSSTSWRDQCLCVRFIVNTDDVFALFKMVVRFLCGLLSDQSQAVLYLLYKHVTPSPVPTRDISKCVQLRFDSNSSFFDHTGWKVFTEKFLQLSTMLIESNSDSIPDYFNECRHFLLNSVSFYIEDSISPNEWICFLQALPLLNYIYLIYIHTRFVTPSEFLQMLASIKECSVKCLAMKLFKKDETEILAYTNAISRTQLPRNMKLSFDLSFCKLTDAGTVERLFSYSANQILSGLRLYVNEFTSDSLSLLANQLPSCQHLRYRHREYSQSEVLISALSSATRINGLHFDRIPTKYHQQLFSLLPQLPYIREITLFNTVNAYSLLPHITHLSTLSYLFICPDDQTPDNSLSDSLLQLLHSNRHSIRGLVLWYSDENMGFSSWDRFLSCLQSCSNLVQLELQYTRLRCDDDTLWCSAVSGLTSLVYLYLNVVSLSDSGLLQLCRGLLFHPAIGRLYLVDCKLSSDSCQPLKNLIPTLKQLKSLRVNNLSEPNPEPVKHLKLTADLYSIQNDLD